jgi:hypothetical protein
MYWKYLLVVLVVYVVSTGSAFYYGKSKAPEKVTTVDKIIEVRKETQQIVQQINIDEIIKKIQESTKNTNISTRREVIIKKDGTRIEREVKDAQVNQTTRSSTESQTKVSELSELKLMIQSLKQQEHTVITERSKKNNWKLGVQVGYGISSDNYIIGLPNHVLVGAFVERQLELPVLGNLGVGVFGTSRADFGLQLSKEF